MQSKIELRIVGKNLDYFFNLLISKNINMEVLEKNNKYITILIDKNNYEKIKKIKTSYKFIVIRLHGFLYFKDLLKRYFSFIFSFFMCMCLLIIVSNAILDIKVITSNKNINKMILEDLKVRGISKYRFKTDFQRKNKIMEEILEEEKDNIEWLEIEEYGTMYKINVVERIKNKPEVTCVPSNIIAKKDAIVLNIEAYSGEVLTAINRGVKKGDILISGNIYNKEEIVNTKCSKGRVFGEVWYQVHIDLPKHYYEENVTGKIEKKLGIELFNYKSKSTFSTYKRKDIYIYNDNILPIKLFFTEYLETNVVDMNFDIHNIDKYALKKAEKDLKNKLGTDDKIILKKILKKEEKNSRIIVSVFFKVYEDITQIQEIHNSVDGE